MTKIITLPERTKKISNHDEGKPQVSGNLVVIPSLEKVIINNYGAFGFDNLGVADSTLRLFLRRNGLNDHLNFELIKGACIGYLASEMEGTHGLAIEVLQQLDTSDIPAIHYGISKSKGKNVDLGGLKFGKLMSYLVALGYRLEQNSSAQNAIRAMKHQEIGFTGHRNIKLTIEQRMDNLVDEQAKLQSLRAFFSHQYPVYDDVYLTNRRENGQAIDSNRSRELYVHQFINLMRIKQENGHQFDSSGFEGRIVPSSSDGSKQYFVQRMVINLPTRKIEQYDCSCPHGYRKMYGSLSRNAPEDCRHIKEFRAELKK